MSMKWIYVISAVSGGMIPALYVYFRLSSSPNYTGADFDLILLSRGMALGFAVMPLGIGAGLFLAAMGQIVVNRVVLRIKRNSDPYSQQANATSWVTRRRREHPVVPGNAPNGNDSSSIPQ